MAEIHCRNFNGYKPCGLSENCDRTCAHFDEIRHHVAIVHLGALGAVLRSTALLPAIHRAFPKTSVTWITQSPADQLLRNNPLIDRVFTLNFEDHLKWQALQADVVFCIDKSLLASGVSQTIRAKEIRGFKADPSTGAILPASPQAHELWSLGLSDQRKFFENTKTENQLVHEALGLGDYRRDEYSFMFTDVEREMIRNRRQIWAPHGEILIGLNTGCSGVIPHKKLTVEFQRALIHKMRERFGVLGRIVLLGGPEDEKRNGDIADGLDVISSPLHRGLRDGMISVACCDLVVTGDSLGLHMAVAQKKWCVAWFGPTCSQEIDLYDRGVKVLSKAPCSPCWKRVCDRQPMCYDLVDSQEIMAGIEKGVEKLTEWDNSSSSKRPSRETCSLASPF